MFTCMSQSTVLRVSMAATITSTLSVAKHGPREVT